MKRSVANMVLVFVTIIWGGGFIATSAALDCFDPFYVLMIRFVGSALISLLIAFSSLKSVGHRTLMKGSIAGVFLFLAFAFQTFGLQSTTASKNAFLTTTNVIFVPYIYWMIFRQRPTLRQGAASFLCVVGIALLTLKGKEISFTIGDCYSLICAIFFACHIISLDWATKNENVLVINAMQMIVAAVLSTLSAMLFGNPPVVIGGQAIASALYLIAISTCLAFLLQTAAQKYTSASSASLILSMEALFASIFSFFLLQEEITFFMMIGGALILSSILLVEYQKTQSIRHVSTKEDASICYATDGDFDEDLSDTSKVLSFSERTYECDRKNHSV